MADTSSLTVEGYGEIGKLIHGGETAASRMNKIALIGATFTANEAVTYAGLTIISGNGLSIATASGSDLTVTVGSSNTTVMIKHEWTASGADEIFGFVATNTDADVAFAVCRFSPTVSITASDTISCQLSLIVDKEQP